MDKEYQILIVDDDEEFSIKILTEFLQDDYKIMTAKSGEQALKVISGPNPPDLILLDIMMPDMDGYEVCQKIKANEKNKHIPIIFVTAVSEAMDAAKAFDLGAVDYVTKPFNPVTVKARVNTHIKLSSAMQDLKTALKKVKKLSGLLPICAQCKKIRDDKGYWNQVESYLQQHSEAIFSHGMCPDCSEKCYGDEPRFKKMMKNKS
jgi:DNA-binding response OmpR family regulator